MGTLATPPKTLIVRKLGIINYEHCLKLMQQWVNAKKPQLQHEIWLVEHPSVYSQGQAGKPQYILDLHGISLVQSDRGGQITYHGPGQLVAYFLFDLQQLQLNVRELVSKTTNSVIEFLKCFGVFAQDDPTNPGVYVQNAKIASLGFRVRKHMSYHGVAININMDLTPFKGIHPCGRAQLVCQLADLSQSGFVARFHDLQDLYLQYIVDIFTFDDVIVIHEWP